MMFARFVLMLIRVAIALVVLPAVVSAQAGSSGTRSQEKASLLHFCQQMDESRDSTLQSVRDRTDCWKRMQLQGMDDSLVDARYQAAVADYDAAVKSDSIRIAGESADRKLVTVQEAIRVRDLDGARRSVDEVLAAQPDNQRALAFRDRIIALTRARRRRATLITIAASILLVALFLAGGSKVLSVRFQRKIARRRASASSQKAMLEIIDGVGRGKMYTMDGPVFRIGSAESERPEEKNHLILSDTSAFISRYHCTIVRKNDQYFLIDSSLNGTYMDEELLDRGEHRALEDGDEFSVAGMARVKFLII